MLYSEELQQKLEVLKNEIKTLQTENKVTEAHAKLSDLENIRKEIEVARATEIEDLEEIENNIEIRKDDKKMNKETIELRAREEKLFANYVRTAIANDMTVGGNGAIIPTSISERIIEKVEEYAPIYSRATKFTVKGDLVFVKESNIPSAEYMDEMTDEKGTDATFATVKLTGFLARALSLVSRSLINKTDFDLVNYVVNKVAKAFALFIERELIAGNGVKIKGLSAVGPTEVQALNADALIDLQMEVPSVLQANCEWLMNPADVKACRKLKDSTGAYLLNADVTSEFGYKILGKDVLMSDQCPAGKVFYGDFSGLYAKLENDVEVQVLKERYAEKFAVGVVGFAQLDACVVEDQKIKAIVVA